MSTKLFTAEEQMELCRSLGSRKGVEAPDEHS
jgi:hypothetical protein